MERSVPGLYLIIILCFSLQIFCVVSNTLSTEHIGKETDKLSLLAFKSKIEGDQLGSWNKTTQFCSWPGVTCSHKHHNRVVALDLQSSRLKGQLSPHIGNLSFLRSLNLANNSLGGEIPQEICRLLRLRELQLSNNSFAGEIPANISRLSRLRSLFMYSNNLTGKIPKDIGLLLELRRIELSVNFLVGEIPASVGNVSFLEELYVGKNSLQGTIPATIGRLKHLKVLVLLMNNLTGTIHPSLYNISTLEYFASGANLLEGNLPPNFGQTLPNLQYFLFHSINFSGPIPATVCNASNLVMLQLNFNNFTGKIPSFSGCVNLQLLRVSSNNLGYAENGDLNFLRDLVNISNLESLGISYNNLGGSIPAVIGNMTSTRIRRFEFGFNQISGEIPSEIGNLVSLEALGLEVNHFTGPIPRTIGRLQNLKFLTFDTNELSGTIPSTVGNLTSLTKLSFARNNLRGNIPPSLGECKALEVLSLAQNNLSGPIPSQVMSLSSLSEFLDLSKNKLNGTVPVEVGELANLARLDISENNLSGEIPKTLSGCTSMEFLYMQGNFLQGSIPRELLSLKGLLVIDLSRNNLSGKIPIGLADLRGLNFLNLSYNSLEDQVPLQGLFRNASRFSVIGNKRLCGGLPELGLPKCTSDLHKNHPLSPRAKLAITISCAFVGLVAVSVLVMIGFKSRKRSTPTLELSVGNSLPRVSYGDLSNATNAFCSANLIGVGGSGSVFKGILNLSQEERLVAVKVLNLHVSRAIKSFIAECQSLGMIRHRNLVKVLTICSSIDFQGNDFKAIVYEFMENGNLEDWLHYSDRGKPEQSHRGLNLIQRINIAIDVASALEYLHDHGPRSIGHCDIKPSNILLDAQMVARVGDFGLAKLITSAFSHSSSSPNQTSSTGIRGTVGYVAPEYAIGSEVSASGDIYSYGIVLLEMFTAKKPTDSMFRDDFNLNDFASMSLSRNISTVLDPMLLEEDEEEDEGRVSSENGIHGQIVSSLVSIIEIGVACSSKFPGERRNIGDVAAELRRIRDQVVAHKTPRNH